MQATKNIIANIRKRAALLIIDEIMVNGCSNCYNVKASIDKVKRELGIELKENSFGYLVFA